jgi:Transposase DDE domain
MIMKEIELISLYFYLCGCNDTSISPHVQRFSANSAPSNEKLTDIELLTIFLYCMAHEQKTTIKTIYDHADRYMRSWFPCLPSYVAFNTRLNRLSAALPYLVDQILTDIQNTENQNIMFNISLLDSLPIMLCSGKRQGRVAPELSMKSYCATKGVYYYGAKLHVLAFRREGRLPIPEYMYTTPADENDLEAVRHLLPKITQRDIYADKAYCDQGLEDALKEVASCVLTPVKLKKGETQQQRQFKKAADDLFSTAVSRVRQPIEGFFNWLIEKTAIQKASKVRSSKGLILHIFGRIAAALCLWLNP